MYDSKRRVRNGWQAFTPELAQSQQDRLQMETHLRRAADNGEFHLVYQPQVDLRHGRIVAAEALIRWQNHQLGEMRPDHFIGHAENHRRHRAHRQLGAARGLPAGRANGATRACGIVRVAVNVSYRQFLGEDLAETVRAMLSRVRPARRRAGTGIHRTRADRGRARHAEDLRRPARRWA